MSNGSNSKVLCFGSVNIDSFYVVPHIVRSGETLSSTRHFQRAGGKGANQCAALAKAGNDTFMAGIIGKDGVWIKEKLAGFGTKVEHLEVSEVESTGRAIIQLSEHDRDNSIILFPGTNHCITKPFVEKVVGQFQPGDWCLLQNEINLGGEIMRAAKKQGMKVIFNPAPFNAEVISEYPLELVNILVVNETEAMGLHEGISGEKWPGGELDVKRIARSVLEKLPALEGLIITLGADGVYAVFDGEEISLPSVKCEVVDTTGAGDTFIAYFLSEYLQSSKRFKAALDLGIKAASIAIGKEGAMDSVPTKEEILARYP
ncbi:ribokinase [Basidiobolus meristosporus CBS 931.73]|uniref:Ribokinase n=1 Tax=Basidiobolus meristosporus CBS 931.73 TaxID=1314790 RepID=A0A1Y1YLL4_9FUNG|nr:ribokinase [Basidiobolus meristosporus CBS 931.73]|eukprot:ORX98892.1 ribokinase [Basidiobolus meristosporus CBS 931.73]